MHPTIRRAIADYQIEEARLAAQAAARTDREVLSGAAHRPLRPLRGRRVVGRLAATFSSTRRGQGRLESEAR